ncbi:MAG: DUF4426 domain-containing protein [Thermomonas sp.]
MLRFCAVILLTLAVAACGGRESAVPAKAMQTSASTTTVGGATLQVSTMAVTDLNDAVARRYAIDRSNTGILLLVTVRDAAGDGIELGDLHLEVVAGALLDAAKPLTLHPITTGGMTDYIGVFNALPPATVQFRISAVRYGARAEISTTAELYPR